MKKIKHILVFSIVLMGTVLLSSCEDNNFEELIEEEQLLGKNNKPDKFIYYQGLRVKHRFKATEEELKVKKDKKSLKALYNKMRAAAKKGKKSKSSSEPDDEPVEEVELPNAEAIIEAAKVVLNQFPYEEIEDFVVIYRPNKEFIDEEMIRDDFPDLTDAEIVANENVIDDYYSENLDYMVLDEIAYNPEIYNGLGIQYQKMEKSDGEIAIAICTIKAACDNGYGYVRSSISYLLATTRADDSSTNYYASKNVDKHNTRRDAYRHILWNSLLAQYYFTISSKSIRLQFAEFVTNARESTLCVATQNPIDSRAMDYHNNAIGRKIWDDNTSYRRIGTIDYGLNKSSTSHLKDLARERVEWNSLYIVKDHDVLSLKYSALEVQAIILETEVDTPVYFNKFIAPIRYIASIELEYYDCDEGNDDFIPKQKNKETKLYSKVPDESGDCFREIIVYTPIYSCYISRDPNFNPYLQ